MNTGTGNYHITPDGILKVFTELGPLEVSGIAFQTDRSINEAYWRDNTNVIKHLKPLVSKPINQNQMK